MVSSSDFPSNSSVHVHHFANELVKAGFDCVVAVPCDKNSVNSLKGNLYNVTQYNEIELIQTLFNNCEPPDLVHAWTPREDVRIFCNDLSSRYEFKLVVHLEDNEEAIIKRFFDLQLKEFSAQNEHLVPHNFSHPRRYQEFLHTADGVTVIIDKLKDFVPNSIPKITLFPGVDHTQFYPRDRNLELAASLNIPDNVTVLCYTGNAHIANQEDVKGLYLAVGQRNLEGKPTILVRTGVDANLQLLRPDEMWVKKYCVELGWVSREQIPTILSLADILVQPGEPDEFNDYRFPSKIPEFLALGKPIIIPNTNIAHHLQHLENALILHSVDRESLPKAIDLLVDNRDLAQKIAKKGLEFALDNLNWTKNTKKLISFYQSLFTPEQELSSVINVLKRMKFHFAEYQDTKTKELKEKNQELDTLRDIRQKVEDLEAEITWMKTSKFWKFRRILLSFKNSVR